jgi:hypothetical protein
MAPSPPRKILTRAAAAHHARVLEQRKQPGDEEKLDRITEAMNQPGEEVYVDPMDIVEEVHERDNGRSEGEGAQDAARTDTETRDAPRLQEDQISSDTQSTAGTASQTSNNTPPTAQRANNNNNNNNNISQPEISIMQSTENEPVFPVRSEDEDSGYDTPLYTNPAVTHQANMTTVGWTGKMRTKYINRYGPKNAAQYRIGEKDLKYTKKDSENVCDTKNRYGDKRREDGGWEYGGNNVDTIYGVAWAGASGDLHDDLDLIDPKKEPKPWPRTFVLVGWKLNQDSDDIVKVWETRTALRSRWGKTKADNIIYKAALVARTRYEEVIEGKRIGESRSPSAGLISEKDMPRSREGSASTDRTSSPEAESSQVLNLLLAGFMSGSDKEEGEDLDEDELRKFYSLVKKHMRKTG